MTVSDGDVLRITAKLSWTGGDVQNVYHAKYAGGGDSDAELMDEINSVLDTAYQEIDQLIPTGVSFDTIEVYNITQDTPLDEEAWDTLTAGTRVGDSLPPQCAALVKFSTATPKSQGRKYLPFFGEGETSGSGQWDAGVLTALAAFAADFIVGYATANGSFNFGNWNDTLVRFSPWLSGIVSDLIRTQRRRVQTVGS